MLSKQPKAPFSGISVLTARRRGLARAWSTDMDEARFEPASFLRGNRQIDEGWARRVFAPPSPPWIDLDNICSRIAWLERRLCHHCGAPIEPGDYRASCPQCNSLTACGWVASDPPLCDLECVLRAFERYRECVP